jgi:hydroxymethylglutaryl-CoA reductase (NADPH)
MATHVDRLPDATHLPLVPRYANDGYAAANIRKRRHWLESICGVALDDLASGDAAAELTRGNIENPVGWVSVPLGIAGPMIVNGEYAQGMVYIPLATTEGALVRSYERGMVATSRGGGVTVRVVENENTIVPVFRCESLVSALQVCDWIHAHSRELTEIANSTTRHGRLMGIDPFVTGKDVYVRFRFHVGDAHGMNMITRAVSAAGEYIKTHCQLVLDFLVTTGACSEKRASGALFEGGKGKRVVAEAVLPASVLRTHLHVTAEQMLDMWHSTQTAQIHANATGYNGHFANGLTAMFIAMGQDVANVTNSAVGLTSFSKADDQGLYMSILLPALTISTVGGGTHLPTSQACLRMIGCTGSGSALRLAEIVAATVLCGELSMGAAIASGEFAAAHERYGRNRFAREKRPQQTVSEVQR